MWWLLGRRGRVGALAATGVCYDVFEGVEVVDYVAFLEDSFEFILLAR